MASEIRVDKITSLSGVGTISPSPTGVEIAGITTVSTLKVGSGTTIFPSGGLFTTNNITIDRGAGDGASLRLISSDNDPDYKLAITDGRFEIQDITNSFASRFAVDTDGSIKVGSGVTLSPDGDIFATGISTFKDGVTITSGSLNILNGSSSDGLNVTSANNTLGIFTSTDSGANIDLFDDTAQSRIRTVSGRLHLYADFNNGVGNGAVADSSIKFFVDGNNEKASILSTGGITFNGDTATANALDDYEEGVHTVTVTCTTSGTITLNTSHNKLAYHKIGNWINVHGRVRVSSTSSPSGQQLRLSLPYQSASEYSGDASRIYGVATIELADQNQNNYGIQATYAGNSFVQVGNINTNTTNPADVCSQVNSNSLISINVTYRTV